MELGAESQAGQYSLFEAVLSKHPYRRRTARPPAKLRGEFTMPPSRHSPDNALAESKNGAVVRKRMGRQFLPSAAAAAGRASCRGRLNPCADFHRAGAFASLTPGSRGKPGKQHKQRRAHLETLAALPAERRSLRPAVRDALNKQRPAGPRFARQGLGVRGWGIVAPQGFSGERAERIRSIFVGATSKISDLRRSLANKVNNPRLKPFFSLHEPHHA